MNPNAPHELQLNALFKVPYINKVLGLLSIISIILSIFSNLSGQNMFYKTTGK